MNLLRDVNRVALILGIESYYSDDLEPLPSCKKDAEDLYNVLSALKYKIIQNAPIIGSKLDKDDGWVKIRVAVGNFFLDAKPSQTLLFYFSGHGIAKGDEVYLGTPQVDFRKPSIKGFALSELIQFMNQGKSIIGFRGE